MPDRAVNARGDTPGTDTFARPTAGMFSQADPGRRGEILDAAMLVFAERGYDGGSMRRIADEVGVSEPALYRHFPGKEALFLAMMRAAAGRLRGEAFALIDPVRPETFRPQLLAAFADRRRAMRLYGPVIRTLLTAAAHNPEFLPEYRAELVLPLRGALDDKVAELDAAFGIDTDADDRSCRVRALMALFVGYFVTSVVLEDESDEAIADAVVRVMGWEGKA
jgi:AcrR family transcriptional regulator